MKNESVVTPRRVAIIGSLAQSLINFRANLIAAIVAQGHAVFAFAPDDDPETAARIAELGAEYVRYDLERTGQNPLADLRSIRDLRTKLAARSIDVAITYTTKPTIYGNYSAWLAGVPRIYSLITGLGFAFTPQLAPGRRFLLAVSRWLMKASLATNERVIFYNQDIVEAFSRLNIINGATPIELVYGSGVDLSRFSFSPARKDPLRFLLVARLLADKGIREYAAAARRLKADHPTVEFGLLGPADPNPAALDLDEVRAWHDEGILHWYGGADDVRPYIRDASVFVLPSYAEGVPRSTQEAMAIGRPVVTTAAPGCRETVVEGDNGFLVPVQDAEALAAAMKRFIDDPELVTTMGDASRRLAEERFDVHKINDSLLTLMQLH